ncbi:MAG TPA: DUF554 domain-containing protein [Candidatus Eisenbergiella merdipullorum]|uniref:DUF554 domain-containing protein n=1 Tax=Candidatus Eisenbergiella merdipullorum TaxID=2838553 RepID=A0A9D2L0M4_9FIRM|nr:DUF554 domain-containing protein [Candidatus Eisenbergiella merdipullorum]
MKGIGTIINVAAVLLGGGAGMLLKGGLKERYQQILMQALGVCTLFIGLAGTLQAMLQIHGNSLESAGSMLLIASLVIGSLLGEWIDIEKWMEHFGVWLRKIFGGKNDNQFVEGFVSASLVICIGAMAIVGALEDGLRGDPSMLTAKAVLDGVIVLVFASAYGKGALFSAIPVGLWQGSITLFAGFLEPFLTDGAISDISFVGNVLIFCVGVNLAFGKKFRVGNMLPALLIAPILGTFL